MKNFLVSLLVIPFLLSSINSDRVNAIVDKYPNKFKTVDAFANRVKSDFKSDKDKAKAIYVWMAKHIKYDLHELYHPSKPKSFSYSSEKEKQQKIKALFNEMALKTLKSKKAVCQGYSTLYKAVCDKVGVKAEIVSGFSKTMTNEIGVNRKVPDHAWNAIMINNKWHFVDVTWGAGYALNNKFVADYSDVYFMMDHYDFLLKHYPENKKWLFLKKSKNVFNNQLVVYRPFFENNVKIKGHMDGIINSSKKKNIQISLSNVPNPSMITYAFLNDKYAKKPEKAKINAKSISFNIEIPRGKNELTVFYNNTALLAYKVR